MANGTKQSTHIPLAGKPRPAGVELHIRQRDRQKNLGAVSVTDWCDWKWQFRNRVTTVDQLKEIINLTPEEEAGVQKSLKVLRMAITKIGRAHV